MPSPDAELVHGHRLPMELDEIVEDDEDVVLHPTLTSEQVPLGMA
jgi:hypothetical protein